MNGMLVRSVKHWWQLRFDRAASARRLRHESTPNYVCVLLRCGLNK